MPAIEAAYRHVASTHDFDATVVAKDQAGQVQIVRRAAEEDATPARTGSNR